MSTTTEETNDNATPVADAARDMRNVTGAVRLSFAWISTRRTLSDAQKRQAADQFDADAEQVVASKKLIDTSHPAYKAVTAIKSQARSYWRGITLPYPVEGIRLIKRDDIATFEARMQEFKESLEAAVAHLQLEYENIKQRAREKLGSLFNAADYPATLTGEFAITWEYPPIEPPRYLMNFNPELYEQEQQRVQQRFEQAVTMFEDSFAEQLQGLITHLIERLSDNADGTPKVFQKSTIENFSEFYRQFKNLNVRGNTDLDALVGRANDLVAGIDPQDLRNSRDRRQELSTQMREVETVLDSLMANQPRRRVMRLD